MGKTLSTQLKIRNATSSVITTSITGLKPGDWVGVNHPGANMHGVVIAPGSEHSREEMINARSTSNVFTMTMAFSNGKFLIFRIDQGRALDKERCRLRDKEKNIFTFIGDENAFEVKDTVSGNTLTIEVRDSYMYTMGDKSKAKERAELIAREQTKAAALALEEAKRKAAVKEEAKRRVAEEEERMAEEYERMRKEEEDREREMEERREKRVVVMVTTAKGEIDQDEVDDNIDYWASSRKRLKEPEESDQKHKNNQVEGEGVKLLTENNGDVNKTTLEESRVLNNTKEKVNSKSEDTNNELGNVELETELNLKDTRTEVMSSDEVVEGGGPCDVQVTSRRDVQNEESGGRTKIGSWDDEDEAGVQGGIETIRLRKVNVMLSDKEENRSDKEVEGIDTVVKVNAINSIKGQSECGEVKTLKETHL